MQIQYQMVFIQNKHGPRHTQGTQESRQPREQHNPPSSEDREVPNHHHED